MAAGLDIPPEDTVNASQAQKKRVKLTFTYKYVTLSVLKYFKGKSQGIRPTEDLRDAGVAISLISLFHSFYSAQVF